MVLGVRPVSLIGARGDRSKAESVSTPALKGGRRNEFL
jgi:hypothetical protein